MRRLLYIDPWAGAAGDMFLAALLDLARTSEIEIRSGERASLGAFGPDPGAVNRSWPDLAAVLADTVAALGLPNTTVTAASATEGGFACLRVTVDAPGDAPARSLADLRALVERAPLPARVSERSVAALERLAAVEARLHGITPDEVRFQEGAVDTLVDVVGTFSLVNALGIERVEHGPVPLGSGRVSTAHGDLGVPAPAALALLRGRPVFGGPNGSEVTTPTGALLLTELAGRWGAMPSMEVEAVGYGAGTRRLRSGPNLLRLVLGRATGGREGAALGEAVSPVDRAEVDTVVELRTCVDDTTPEVLAHTHGLLLRAGALDAWWTPVYMKKGRPGAELTVLTVQEDEPALVGLLLRETTTFGVRRYATSRHRVAREWVEVDLRGAVVRVKLGRWSGRVVSISPEYEDAAAAADRLEIPLKDVMQEATAAARRLLNGSHDL